MAGTATATPAAGTGDPAAGGTGTPPAGSGNGTPPPGTGTPPPAGRGSGDGEGNGAGSKTAVLAELAEERRARQKLDADLAEMKAKHQTAEEKAIDAAKKEGAAEATTAANRRIVKSEIRAASAGKVSDPEDAAALLGDLDRFIVKGEVDSKAISAAIDDLVKSKPYLAPAGRARPLPGGGVSQSTGTSMNDDIRRRIRGG